MVLLFDSRLTELGPHRACGNHSAVLTHPSSALRAPSPTRGEGEGAAAPVSGCGEMVPQLPSPACGGRCPAGRKGGATNTASPMPYDLPWPDLSPLFRTMRFSPSSPAGRALRNERAVGDIEGRGSRLPAGRGVEQPAVSLPPPFGRRPGIATVPLAPPSNSTSMTGEAKVSLTLRSTRVGAIASPVPPNSPTRGGNVGGRFRSSVAT